MSFYKKLKYVYVCIFIYIYKKAHVNNMCNNDNNSTGDYSNMNVGDGLGW